MVDGHEKTVTGRSADPRTEIPCIVVDLDGTLLRANSLRLFIRFMARKFAREGRVVPLVRILWLLAARRARLIPHVGMKYPIHRLAAATVGEDELEEFAGSLRGYVCAPLLSELSRLKGEGWRVMLATAAPSLYVPQLADHLGIDEWVATPLTDTPASYTETRGERKLELALGRAAAKGWRIRAVATDHEDDLPVLRLDGVRRLLVNSTDRLSVMMAGLGLAFEKIDCR